MSYGDHLRAHEADNLERKSRVWIKHKRDGYVFSGWVVENRKCVIGISVEHPDDWNYDVDDGEPGYVHWYAKDEIEVLETE